MNAAPPPKGSRPIGLWIFIACTLLFAIILTTISVAWAVRRAFLQGQNSDPLMSARQKEAVLAIAGFPTTVKDVIQQVLGHGKNPLLTPRSDATERTWVRRFPAPEDSGYLLFSGLYRNESATGVKLIRIADGRIMASWSPDWPAILARITKKKFDGPVDVTNARPVDPLLLDDGDIVFSGANASIRMSTCSAQPRWVLDEIVHHSNDLDLDGNSFWSATVAPDSFPGNPILHAGSRDDAIAKISLDGKLLERLSFAAIAHDNDLDFLLFNGNEEGDFNADPIHMNQVRVARIDSKFWKRGDLLVSVLNPNTVLLYRPSTKQVIWRQTGPWIHQHSADFVNDHQISVFNNNSVLHWPETAAFLDDRSINEVMVYDFETNRITQPFKPLLEDARPRTVLEGRARVLPDGGLFVEETGSGRILRFAGDRLLWSYVNDHDDKNIGALAWSTYLTAEEARKPLEALGARHCAAGAPVTH